MNPMDLLPVRIEELVHELSVLPFNDLHGTVTSPLTLTNYTFWGLIALVTTILFFTLVATKQRQRIAAAEASGKATDLAPTGRLTGMLEAGVEFVRDMAVDVIGPKDGPKYVAFLCTIFFMILISNMYGLIPGAKSFAGSIGGTVALALVVWVVFVFVGFKKNGAFGYMKSLIPEGVRKMPLAARIGLGGFIFLLEFISTFLVRPLTQSVRLFANMYAGHVILGVFGSFVWLFVPVIKMQAEQSFSVGGAGIGLLAMVFLIIMYAFEVFVAFIQAYVFTILTAVYIQSSVHASEH